jgi:hypothetical protein
MDVFKFSDFGFGDLGLVDDQWRQHAHHIVSGRGGESFSARSASTSSPLGQTATSPRSRPSPRTSG